MSLNAVPCPECASRVSRVIDSRGNDLGEVRRRRVCAACGKRFTTLEVHESENERRKVPLVQAAALRDAAQMLIAEAVRLEEPSAPKPNAVDRGMPASIENAGILPGYKQEA